MADFDWQEETGPGGRASGECVVRLGGQEVVRIRYRQGRVPLPSIPVRAAAIREDMVLCCSNRLRGRYRWSTVLIEPSQGDRPLPQALRQAGPDDGRDPGEGVMADDVRVLGFLPERNPHRIEVEQPVGLPSSAGP